jgi:hypothetical protein
MAEADISGYSTVNAGRKIYEELMAIHPEFVSE